jgi:hypothetical protein
MVRSRDIRAVRLNWAYLVPLLLFLCYINFPQPVQGDSSCAPVCMNAQHRGTHFNQLPPSLDLPWALNNNDNDNDALVKILIDSTTADPNVYFSGDVRKTECFLNVTFAQVSLSASRSRLGLFEFDRSATSAGRRLITETLTPIFEDITTDTPEDESVPCLARGATVTMGPFSPGASIGFYLDLNAACVDNPTRFYSLDEENLAPSQQRRVAIARVRLTNDLFSSFSTMVVWSDILANPL